MKTTINKTGFLFSLIMIMSLIASPLMAQENDDPRGQRGHDVRYERLKSMKVAYITQELNLTPAEAEKFWPLYNEFEAKRNEIASSIMQGHPREMPDFGRMSDEEVNELIILKFKEERAMVNLQEEYYEKYKKVLPIKKVAKYYESEKRFRSHLLHQIRDGKFKEGKEEYRRVRDN